MWMEVISLDEKEDFAELRNMHGCTRSFSVENINRMKEAKPDCHFYKYKSDNIELAIGFLLKKDYYWISAYTLKAEAEDYPEALRLMAEKKKEFVSDRKVKKMVMSFGYEDEAQLNLYNKGVGKLGVVKVIELAKPEYLKAGINISFNPKQIVFELI